MSFTLPHDLSEKKELQVSMLDDNFDAIQIWGRDFEARFVGLFKQVDALQKELTAMKRPAVSIAPSAKPKPKAKKK